MPDSREGVSSASAASADTLPLFQGPAAASMRVCNARPTSESALRIRRRTQSSTAAFGTRPASAAATRASRHRRRQLPGFRSRSRPPSMQRGQGTLHRKLRLRRLVIARRADERFRIGGARPTKRPTTNALGSSEQVTTLLSVCQSGERSPPSSKTGCCASHSLRVFANSSASNFSSGSTVWYSAASTLLGRPSSA